MQSVRKITFDEALSRFLKAAQAKVDFGYKDSPYRVKLVAGEPGRRYIRVIRTEIWDGKESPNHRSVYCFVELDTGRVLKAESWKRPARHARGNIFNPDHGAGAVSPWGANYLR